MIEFKKGGIYLKTKDKDFEKNSAN